ncbi:MAG TPA: hypothetical protein VET89_08060 [Stellaceae bacterium]|nr:hypothetical protein [Stellaceae bacterium]
MTFDLSRSERLERWASVIENYDGPLKPFGEVEFMPSAARAPMRQASSPLAVAYQDPVLRRAGLGSDRFGEGEAFFGMSRSEAHRVLCSCGYIGTMRAADVAERIRAVAMRERRRLWRPVNPLPALARWLSGWRSPSGFTRPA